MTDTVKISRKDARALVDFLWQRACNPQIEEVRIRILEALGEEDNQ